MSEQGKQISQLPLKQRLRQWARKIKSDILTIYYALKHPKTPLHAMIVGGIVVGYALSPIDLIPDFIPVLGYLDDVIIVPLGIMLVMKLIPADVIDECRELVRKNPPKSKPKIWISAYIIVVVWIVLFYGVYHWLLK